MVKTNKTILRSLLILSYIVIVSLVVYGISAVFSYLNSGADRSTMLHIEVKKIDQYLPNIQWQSFTNEGRVMDETTLTNIENDYLDAWYVKQVAYSTNLKEGVADYYTESARENLFNIIDLNKKGNVTINGTTLQHNPTLEFFSEDGQLAVITDNNVVEYKRIYKANELVLETKEVSNYKIILLLEDGFWRIRHMVKEEVMPFEDSTTAVDLHVDIKGINYYPQATPWNLFGDEFNTAIVASDFNLIKSSGLNSVRVFIPYEDFGKAKPNLEKIDKLKQLLDIAQSENLKVVLTLFDFYGDYSVLDWTLNQKHATTIVSAFKDHEALLAWDVKNEPDLDFTSRGKENVIAWLQTMITTIKTIDTKHPVTIGWSNASDASFLKDKVDFVSFHYYEKIEKLSEVYSELRTQIPNKNIVVSEFGLSSYRGLWNPFGNSENVQAVYHKTAQKQFKDLEIPYMSWTLYDFTEIPKEVVGRLPWRQSTQKYYGFISANGTKKNSFKYISKD